MDNWKDELKQAFDAPPPMQKKIFLQQLHLTKISMHEFIFSQIFYIRKWVWCASILIFFLSILSFTFLPDTIIWFISGLTPLLALTILSESGRSECYKMAELELATRFSLRSIIFARLTILGILNLLILGVFLFLGLWNDTTTPLATILYIITPFLLTTFTGLYSMRKFRGQEAMSVCVGCAVGISLLLFLSHTVLPFIYQEQYIIVWLIIALSLLFGNGKQYITIIKQTEDLVWNLS